MNNFFQDKTITSISFIGSHPPRSFGGSFDELISPYDDDRSVEKSKTPADTDHLIPTRIFVQSFDNASSSLEAYSARFISADRFLNLLRRSRPSDVFVFSGTCQINTNAIADDTQQNTNNDSSPLSTANLANQFITREKVPSDAFLWFSGENSDGKGARWVSGKEIAAALVAAKNINAGGQGGGVVFLNCDYSCFVAQNQFASSSASIDSSSSSTTLLPPDFFYNFSLTRDEKLSNVIITILRACSVFSHKSTNSYIDLKLDKEKIIFEQLLDRDEDIFRSQYAKNFIQNCDFDRNQLPLQIVPLAFGTITSENDRESILDIMIQNRLFHNFRHRKLQQFHETISQNIANGAVIWSEKMILTRLFPESESHQKFMFSLLKSESWEQMLGVMSHIQTQQDAKNYIIGRPLKMFHEHGIGSFAIVVPMEREVSSNELKFNEMIKRNQNEQAEMFDDDEQEGSCSSPSWTRIGNDDASKKTMSTSSRQAASPSKNISATVTQYQLVGIAGAYFRAEMEGDFDLGFALLPEFQGRGYATMASQLVLKWARRALGLNRIRSVTAAKNGPSLKLLEERLGFTKMYNGETRTFSWNEPNFVLEREL